MVSLTPVLWVLCTVREGGIPHTLVPPRLVIPRGRRVPCCRFRSCSTERDGWAPHVTKNDENMWCADGEEATLHTHSRSTAASERHQGPALPNNKEQRIAKGKKLGQLGQHAAAAGRETGNHHRDHHQRTTNVTCQTRASIIAPIATPRPHAATNHASRTPAAPGERGEEMVGEMYSKNRMPPKSRPSCRSRSAACGIPTRTSPGTPESVRPPSSSRACRSWEFQPNTAARTPKSEEK